MKKERGHSNTIQSKMQYISSKVDVASVKLAVITRYAVLCFEFDRSDFLCNDKNKRVNNAFRVLAKCPPVGKVKPLKMFNITLILANRAKLSNCIKIFPIFHSSLFALNFWMSILENGKNFWLIAFGSWYFEFWRIIWKKTRRFLIAPKCIFCKMSFL